MEKLLCEWLKSEANKKGMQIDTPEINQSEKQAINSIIEKYDLKSKSRRRTLVYPRFYFVHFLVKIMNKEPFEVAYMLGKDRTSMLYAAKEAQRYISDNDSYFLKMVEGIKNDLSKIQPKKVALVSDLKVLKRVTGKSKNKRTQISLCSEKDKEIHVFVIETKRLIDFKNREIYTTIEYYSIETACYISDLLKMFFKNEEIYDLLTKELESANDLYVSSNLVQP